MISCGVIAEYNPFHTGHAYHLKETRKLLPETAVIVVCMSGNFTQRGEPAIVDKWTRAQMALANGADIIVEQSILGTVQSADYFARAGVRTLSLMGCSYLSFGSEAGNADQFEKMASILLQKEAEVNRTFQNVRNKSESYPTQMDEVIRQTMPEEFAFYRNHPNAKLGVSYLVANGRGQHGLRALVIKRQDSNHHDTQLQDRTYASGSAIRKALLTESFKTVARWLPEGASDTIVTQPFVHWELLWPHLQYKLIATSLEELQTYLHVEEGIENRLKHYVTRAQTMNEFLTLVKNKRWTWVRLQRVCTSILLNLTKQEAVAFFEREEPLRILGFTQRGQAYLQEKKESLSFVTNLRQDDFERLSVSVRSDDIYRLANPSNILEQNRARIPIRV